jgi:multidrug efflux pump subunit AcrA (membrane-fusion protein)
VVAPAAGAGAYYYWQQQGAAGRLDIQTAEVKRGDVRRVVATSGTVSALVTVDIGSQLSGNIGAVNVDYSTEVKQDEVLARIEPLNFETRVREEEAAEAVAKANVDLQEAGIGRAAANLHKAELDLGRAKELVTEGAPRKPHWIPPSPPSKAPWRTSPSPRPTWKMPRRRSPNMRRHSTAHGSTSTVHISALRSTAW